MTETLSHKEQHQLRAKLARDGQRVLAAAAMTDYRAAKPTHKPKPAKTMTVTATDGTTAAIEVTDAKVIKAVRDGQVSAYSMAIANATTPKPLPKPDTRHGLLARLNARHNNTTGAAA